MISSRLRGRDAEFCSKFVCDMQGTFNVQTSDLVGRFKEIERAIELGAKINVSFF